jgi:DNA transformation protein and related proteins
MSANDELLEILKDALGRIGAVSGRHMFGGVGVYFDGIFFAIIDDGAIYLKTSDETRPAFEAECSRAFSYMTKTGPAELRSYWRLPERLLDDMDELREWARASIAAACDVALEKKRKAGGRAKPSHSAAESPKRTAAKRKSKTKGR